MIRLVAGLLFVDPLSEYLVLELRVSHDRAFMNEFSASTPVQKTVVLVGAGNAHLVFIRKWRMRPVPGVAVTLVNEAPAVPYSAMVPAYLAGDYTGDEITIDLVQLCRSAGLRLVSERVVRLDSVARRVEFAARPPLSYDVLSLGLGSVPADLTQPVDSSFTITLRPLAALIGRILRIDASLIANPRPFHLVIVGGGASGCELALAIHSRLHYHPGFCITVLQGNSRMLPQFPTKTASAFERAFLSRGISWRVDASVTGGKPGTLTLADGEQLPCDGVLWATPGLPPEFLRSSGLATDDLGFLRVRETLQAESDTTVFGAGDCVSFAAHANLSRSGVHAVRQGAVLHDNMIAFLQGRQPTAVNISACPNFLGLSSFPSSG